MTKHGVFKTLMLGIILNRDCYNKSDACIRNLQAFTWYAFDERSDKTVGWLERPGTVKSISE